MHGGGGGLDVTLILPPFISSFNASSRGGAKKFQGQNEAQENESIFSATFYLI